MYRRLLVPLDGSELSAGVLFRGRKLIQTPGIHVKVVSVIEADDEEVQDLRFRVHPRHQPRFQMLRAVEDELALARVSVESEILFGDPAHEILREINRGRYEVVAMTTHGRTGLARALFGSVAHKILQSSSVPLILFRPLQRADGTLSWAERHHSSPLGRILVPLDGSEEAEEILPHAAKLAETFDGTLYLLTVAPPGPDAAAQMRIGKEYLARRAQALSMEGTKPLVAVRVGRAEDEILEMTRKWGLDAIAMTTHGRSGLARVLYGSVAESVLRRSEVPMLIFRSQNLRSSTPIEMEEPEHAKPG